MGWKKNIQSNGVSESIRCKIIILFGLIVMMIFIIGVIFVTNDIGVTDSEGDVSNTYTLVIEIGIGIFIAISILLYSIKIDKENKLRQTKITELIEKIDQQQKDVKELILGVKQTEAKQEEILKNQDALRQSREKAASQRLRIELGHIQNYLAITKSNVDKFNEIPPMKEGAGHAPEWQDAEKFSYRFHLEQFNSSILPYVENLETLTSLSSGDLELGHIEDVHDIMNLLKHLHVEFKKDVAQFTDTNVVQNKITKLLEKLPNPSA